MSGRVARIRLAPVKSLHLVDADEVQLDSGGIRGDRRFFLLDEQGRRYNGKRDERLVQITPAWDEVSRRLTLTFPDGSIVDGIVELGEPVDAGALPAGVRATTVIGPWAAAIETFVGEPLRLLWADDGLTDRWDIGGDVSLVSQASLARLAAEAAADAGGLGDVEVDDGRFRMTFLLDGLREHEEDGWIGRHVRIGAATVEVKGDVGRCVVTTRDPDTGEHDLSTLRLLGRYRRDGVTEPLPFGVYGRVVDAGRVRTGDAVGPTSK
jgi:uncharacterized protein YcbX